jgi:integrase
VVAPTNQNRSVARTRRPNAEIRTREYLTAAEVDKLIKASKHGRYPQRDATLILVTYRHGLRATELCDLEWSQVDFDTATLHVRRAKNGEPACHPIRGDELRQLRQLRRDQAPGATFVFTNERGAAFTTDAVNRLVQRIGEKTSIDLPVHIHMLRHACGYALANKGHDTRAIQDWLGHKAIQHTVRYTELTPTRFKDFWRD